MGARGVVEAEEGAETLIGEFTKNSREVVRGRLTEYQNHELADVRVFVMKDDGSFAATRKGLCLSRSQLPQLEDLVRALRETSAAE